MSHLNFRAKTACIDNFLSSFHMKALKRLITQSLIQSFKVVFAWLMRGHVKKFHLKIETIISRRKSVVHVSSFFPLLCPCD